MRDLIKRQANRKIQRGVVVSALGATSVMGAMFLWNFEITPSFNGKLENAPEATFAWNSEEEVATLEIGLQTPDTPDKKNIALDSKEIHSLIHDQENGVRVVRIQLVEDGDEIVVNAETGQFIEKRPARSTQGNLPAKSPMGVPMPPAAGSKTSMG